jgi:hypothetical protein
MSDINSSGHLFITIKFFKFTERDNFNNIKQDQLRVKEN